MKIPNKKNRADLVLKLLSKKYRNYPATGLTGWKEDWQYLTLVILSAQTNDDQVNKIAKTLFNRYKTIEELSTAKIPDLEKILYTVGFFRTKARYIIESARSIISNYNGKIPNKLSSLVTLPGVGRKTANVFQGVIYGRSEGIAVDTHVARTSRRLKLTDKKISDKIEQDLIKLYPKSKYHMINPILFWHGREICTSRKPVCKECELNKICPDAFRLQL